MATHSPILAWRIPWTEEPGGLPSMGSRSVRHDRVAKHIHTQVQEGSLKSEVGLATLAIHVFFLKK